MTDLFAAAATERMARGAPLAERMRPLRLDEVVGQQHLVGPGGTLTRLVRAARMPSVVLWGPAGSGKTTLARLVAVERADAFVALSAVSASVRDIRATAEEAERRLGMHGTATVLFLDEIHRFTRSQQDALLPSVESGLLSLIGATTESPWATIVGPLLSRCTVLRLEPISGDDLSLLVDRALDHVGGRLHPEARDELLATADGDARKALTTLDVAIALSGSGTDPEIDLATLRMAVGAGDLRYGRGSHYDAASAFIKWMRHSDPVQAVAWLVHMLDSGEDPRFVARRMVIFASEDVGTADHRALLIADAAARAVDAVGLPEARYALVHAAGYLARAPKSREVADELAAAPDTVRILPPELGGPPLRAPDRGDPPNQGGRT